MLDNYNRNINYLRISVTDRCNLRCKYCISTNNFHMFPHDDIVKYEEILEVVNYCVPKGVNKIRLTGGEPLVRKGIVDLVSMVAEIDGISDFAMTTNGVLLPEFAKELKNAGLHRLNISLDTTDPVTFKDITQIGNVGDVIKGILAAKEVGFKTIKLNCVIKKHSDEKDARLVAEFANDNGLEVRYINQMDIIKGKFSVVQGGTGGNCGICNRLRLSSNGYIYPCLFNDMKYSIRESGVKKAIDLALLNKPESGKKSNHNKFNQLGG